MGLDMLLSRNIRRSTIRIVAGVAILSLFLLAGSAGASPPPAILKIDGNEQTSGIGSYCWKEENQNYSLCADMIGDITPTKPSLTGSPFTAHLRFTLQEPPEEAGFSAIRVTDDDELKMAGYNSTRAWRLTPEHIQQLQVNGNYSKNYKLPSECESDINLSLEPGLYVLNVDATWKDKGSATYGFLVQVYNPAAEVTNKINPAEKAAGFQFALAITILLAVYASGRKRK